MTGEEDKSWTVGDGRRVRIVDAETGEVLDPDGFLVEKKVPAGRDYWWRFMVCDLLDVLEEVPGRQIHAVRAILAAVSPYDNRIIGSLAKLAKAADCSEKTMWEAMNLLRRHDIIRMEQRGVYVINPRFMSQGGGSRKFSALAIRYDSAAAGHLRVVDGGQGDGEALEG
jgi:hypothetical protein